MKIPLSKFTLCLLFVAALIPAYGQTAITSTTLAAAVTDTSSRTVCLAASTGVAANTTALYVDREMLLVESVNTTSNCAVVMRGAGGTRSMTHANAATVYIFPISGAQSLTMNLHFGTCTAGNELYLPHLHYNIREGIPGVVEDCFGSAWQWDMNLPLYRWLVSPQAQRSAATPAAGASSGITSQAGGASTAAATAGAVGGAATFGSGAGGAGASTGTGGAGGESDLLSGAGGAAAGAAATGGAGGLVKVQSGAGGGTITGGAGGEVRVVAGNGANGSTAGGTGGAVNIASGAAGTGGTGTSGAIAIKSGGTSGTAVFSTSAAGATSVASAGTAQTLTLAGSTSGKVTIADGTDATKKVIVDPSGNSANIATTLAFGATSARTMTFPDASITVPGTILTDCGSSASCASPTTRSSTMKVVIGTVAFSSSTTATITAMAPAFTGTQSYTCYASDPSHAAYAQSTQNQSGTSFIITSGTSNSDTWNYMCIGY